MASFTPSAFNFATVMNVKIYAAGTSYASIIDTTTPATVVANIDSLRISNIGTEGPTKSYKGGLYGDTLVRHGKTMTITMEDVIVRQSVLTSLFGVDITSDTTALTFRDTFSSAVVLFGETFVVNEDGTRSWINLYAPEFLPNGLLNITMEAEGDFAVIELSGELFPDDCGNFIALVTDATPPCGA